MKKIILLLVLLAVLLVFPYAFAEEIIKEQVKCVFLNTNSEQKCYTSDGRFACSGIGSCLADVYGTTGARLEWKNSCSGYPVYTVLDGNSESVEVKCTQELTVTPAQPTTTMITTAAPTVTTEQAPADVVKEQVKCLFLGSSSEQKCYTIDGRFACSGAEKCIVDVYGQHGQQLQWKSSCGGEAYTKIDGLEESAGFKCEAATTTTRPVAVPEPITTPQATPNIPENIYEEIICIFHNSMATQQCSSQDGLFSCSGTDKCIAKVYGQKGKAMQWKSTCQKQEYPPYIIIDGAPEQVWFNCQNTIPTTVPVPVVATPPVASDTTVTEQVKCTFIDPDPMLKHSCGASGGSCTWIWEGIKTEARDRRMGPLLEKEINGEKVKYAGCTAEVIGQKGEKKVWRSTCGGEASSVMDSANEEVEFRCLSDRQVDIEQISKKGFKYAFWWCQGGAGTSSPPGEEACKTADAWKRLAEEYCANSCHKDILGNEKCGLYSFSVSQECYFASEAEKQAAETMQITAEEIKIRQTSPPKMHAAVLIYSYIGECPECSELGREDDQLPLMTQDRAKTTDFRYADFNYKQFLDKYPTENVLLYLDIMSEATDPPTAYAKVYERPGKADYKTAEDWWRNQVLTKAIRPVYDTLSDKVITAPEIKKDVLVYYYSGDCPECEKLKNIQKDIGENPIEVNTESSGTTSMSLAVVAALKSFLEKHKAENYLIYGMYSGNNDLSLYAKAGKAEYEATAEWIRQIRAGRLTPDGIVGKTEEEVKKQLGKGAEKEAVYEKAEEQMKKQLGNEAEKEAAYEKTEKEPKQAEEPEIIICKDSCPLGSKCYPFGYRKAGKFCTDEGAFKDQLQADAACDNNFECSTNLCIDGKCMSSGLIQKFMGWFKKLFVGREEAKEEETKSIDCGTSSECMENAFKECKPAKMSQTQGGPISEIAIVGLEGKKCVLKFVAGTESMTCKFENYVLGLKDMGSGSIEQYCSGPLTYRLAATPKMVKVGEAPALNSVVIAKKLSADPNDLRYSFTVRDPEGVREFSIVKSDFGEVAVKAEPACAKDFTSELKFNPSDLPFRASVIDCGTPITRHELKVETQIPISPAPVSETRPAATAQPQQTEKIKQENIQEPVSAQQKTLASQQVSTTPGSSELSKEQVRCKFIDPELIQRCYADFGKLGCSNLIRKCYTDDNRFGCSDLTTASTPLEGGGFEYVPFCVAEVYGRQGAKLTWKASCGEESYTVIDRSNEDITFMCMPSGSTIKGYLYASWKCNNGEEEKSINGVDLTTCKSSEIWKEYADKACKGKAGLKKFDVSEECVITVKEEGVFISAVK